VKLFYCLLIAASILSGAYRVPLGAADLDILPRQVVLHGSQGRQRLSVVVINQDRIGAAVASDQIQLESSDVGVVEIHDSVAVAIGDGQADIIARDSDGNQASRKVTVVGTQAEHRWSFRNDVQSVLTKLGCNSGACHGALAGKGGFRLSLQGYDSDADFQTIAREARGRRLELSDPGLSLLLAKPTGAVPHKGGLKLDPNSHDYQVIADWIASGAVGPDESDAVLDSIKIVPESALLSPGEHSQILVHASYSDGRTVDVTEWAKFTSTDEAIASVDDQGLVTVRGSGEGAVLVWFGSKVALARMTVPYPHDIASQVYIDAPRRNFIDTLNLDQLAALRLRPADRCDDNTFLRRATLDTIGRLPTQQERDTYYQQSESTRRDWLIQTLLSSEDFVDYWTYRWCDILMINGTRLRPIAVKSYYQWVRDAVRQNMPWDVMVRELLTSTGRTDQHGATNFFSVNQSPEEMTENACQAFLGLSIGCAKCHNHPLEKWTNDQYYAMANLFARVRAKGWGGDGRNGDGIRTVFVSTTGELIQPSRGVPQPPAPLDAAPLAFDDPTDRREALAEWMTDPANPYFSRAIANRVWANFFGRGLVEQVDDLRLSNPASCEPLLSAIAQHVVDSNYDLKQLMFAILRSETYQRSSLGSDQNRDETKYFSRYYPRRLMAEVLLDSIDQVLQTSTNFNQIAFPGADYQKTDFYPTGTRAIELYDAAVDSYFLQTFGRNSREITCECERSSEPSMVQVLHLSNGQTLNPKLMDQQNRIAQQLAAEVDDQTIIVDLFVAALCREPTTTELAQLLAIRQEYGADRKAAIEDIAWSILTNAEFVFNH
jgi:hypothetical protein